jgi:hypothetical protein
MDANVSPGAMAMAQTIAIMYLKVSLKNFRIGFMATPAVDWPVQPDESIEHDPDLLGRAFPLFQIGQDCFFATLAKETVRASGLGRSAQRSEEKPSCVSF